MIQQFFDGLNRQPPYTAFHLYHAETGETIPVSSQQLLMESHRWQLLLCQHPEPVVAIFGHMTLAMISAWLGSVLAGKKPVFLSYPSHKIQASDYDRKMANYITRFGDSVFVGEQSDRAVCTTLLSPADLSNSLPQASQHISDHPPSLQKKNTALFIQCGSGTTGLQKAVAVTTQHLENQIRLYSQTIALNPDHDTVVSWLPLYHDMGLVAAFLLPLITRTPFILIDTFEWAANPDLLLRIIAAQKATLCWLPNFAFALLGRNPSNHDLSSMRAFINCSEPVSAHAMLTFLQAHRLTAQPLSICYALAENVFSVAQSPLEKPPQALRVERMALQRREVNVLGSWSLQESATESPYETTTETLLFSCGPIMPEIKLRIDCRKGQQVGDIFIAGPCAVAPFSANEPVLSPTQAEPWIATGDQGFMHEGELYICGRSKDLIIHNGKNIYPQDLEEIINQYPEVYPGRVCAVGHMDKNLASEQILLLFEPRHYLSLQRRPTLCAEMGRELEQLFDIRAQVINVPRTWLQKTSSGKMARRAVLDRYLSCQDTTIYLCGDSHVRLFWSSDTSHQNIYQHIQACWLGVLWADNWQQSIAFFADLIPRLNPKDALVIQVGEPECRTIFPRAADPLARIEESVNQYHAFFLLLRQIWPGRLAYMTGIPTHPHNGDNGDVQWPICGEPQDRYRYQTLFYQRMEALCSRLIIHYIDVCSPLLEEDGFMDSQRLADKTHLSRDHQDLYCQHLEQSFGLLNYSLDQNEMLEDGCWDGTYDHYQHLIQQKIQSLAMGRQPDWDHLISAGTLDSLAIIELITMLNRVCRFAIQPASILRNDFESISTIYQKFAPKTPAKS